MTQYWTDFSEYSTGVGAPSGWNGVAGDWSIVDITGTMGGKVLRGTGTSENILALWTTPGSQPDSVETLIRVRRTGTVNVGAQMGSILHCFTPGGGLTNLDGYSSEYEFVSGSSINYMTITRWDGSGVTTNGSGNLDLASAGQWWWIRTQRIGTTVRTRAWVDGSLEPGTWNVSITDSTHTSGYVGTFGYAYWGTNAVTYEWDMLGIGTNGDPAPTAQVNTAPRIIELPTVEYQSGTSVRPSYPTATITFTAEDDEQASISWEIIRDYPTSPVTLASGTATSGLQVTTTVDYTGLGSDGTHNLYLSVFDGVDAYDSATFDVVRETPVNPGEYRVVFTPADATSTQLSYTISTGSGGTGTVLATGTATAGVETTTAAINGDITTNGTHTRYIRLVDEAGNIHDSSFTVEATGFGQTYNHLTVATNWYVNVSGLEAFTSYQISSQDIQQAVTEGTDFLTSVHLADVETITVPVSSDVSMTLSEALGEQLIINMIDGMDLAQFIHTGEILGVTAPISSEIVHDMLEVANEQGLEIYQESEFDFLMDEMDDLLEIPVFIEGVFGSIWNDLDELQVLIFTDAPAWVDLHEEQGELTVYVMQDAASVMVSNDVLTEFIVHTVVSGFDFDPGDADVGFLFMLATVTGDEVMESVETEPFEIYWDADADDSMTWVDYLQTVDALVELFADEQHDMDESIYPTIVYTDIDGVDSRVWNDLLDSVVEQFMTDGLDTTELWDVNPYNATINITGIDMPAFNDMAGEVHIHVVLEGLDRIPLRLYLRFDETALIKMEPYAGDVMPDLVYTTNMQHIETYTGDMIPFAGYTGHMVQSEPYDGDIEKI